MTARKPAARKAATAKKPASTKAAGRHIPPAPSADATAAPGGSPGSSLNPADPAAPNYRFEGAGDPANSPLGDGFDHGSAVQPTEHVLAPVPEGGAGEADNGLKWIDEQTALGRRIAVVKGDGDGADETVTTHEEIVPHGATEAQITAARERLSRKLAA